MDDGSEEEFAPGDVGYVPPRHNAWIIGTAWQDLKVHLNPSRYGQDNQEFEPGFAVRDPITYCARHQFRALS